MHTTHQYADLLRALDGMRNVRAIATVIAGFILAFIVIAAGMATNNIFGIILFGLIGWLIAGFGSNAAGIVLMHQALEQEPPSVIEALLGGMTSFLKLLAIFIILALLGVAYTIVVAVLLFICKVPAIGPLFFALLLPVIIVVSGAAYMGLVFGAGLMAPAVWRGASVQQALVEFFTILRDKLIETIVRYFLLALLLFLVFGVVMAILGVGMMYTLALSATILDSVVGAGFGGIGGLGGMMGNLGRMGAAGGYAYAGLFGFGILYALVLGVGFCVATMGGITIYLAVSDGIDTGEMEEKLSSGLAQAKQKAADVEQRLKTQNQPPAAPAVPPVQVAPTCPACRAPITADDVFCGNCGHRLH